MKYLVEYYCIENRFKRLYFRFAFNTLDSALDFVKNRLSVSTPNRYYVISAILRVNENLTNFFDID